MSNLIIPHKGLNFEFLPFYEKNNIVYISFLPFQIFSGLTNTYKRIDIIIMNLKFTYIWEK